VSFNLKTMICLPSCTCSYNLKIINHLRSDIHLISTKKVKHFTLCEVTLHFQSFSVFYLCIYFRMCFILQSAQFVVCLFYFFMTESEYDEIERWFVIRNFSDVMNGCYVRLIWHAPMVLLLELLFQVVHPLV